MRGRIRTIKPELFSNEELWELGERSKLPVLQAFAGLWCFADREGRFEWRPRRLQSLIVPYWRGEFSEVLDALERERFVVRYVVDGLTYGYIRNWHKHQRPDHREPESVLPVPTAADIVPLLPGETRACPGGREGNDQGREREGTDARAPEPPARHAPRPLHIGSAVGIARTYTMPSETPPKAFLDVALMGGVGPDQAKSTWAHYWGAGLPPLGVERLHDWLTQRAKERQESQARLKKPEKGPNQPNAGMTGLEIFTRKAG